MRRTLWILLTPITGFTALALLWLYWLNPQLESWIHKTILEQTQKHTGLIFTIEQVEIDLFYPRIALKKITLQKNSSVNLSTAFIEKTLQKLEFDSIEAKVDAFRLLTGGADLSAILIQKPVIEINLDPLLEDKTPSKEIPVEQIFNVIKKLPLSKILTVQGDIRLQSNLKSIRAEISPLRLSLEKNKQLLLLNAETPKLQLQTKDLNSLTFNTQISASLSPSQIKIQQITANSSGLSLKVFGEIPRWQFLTTQPEIQLQPQFKINFKELAPQLASLFDRLPEIHGSAEGSFQLQYKNKKANANGEIRLQKVSIDEFQIGDARLDASLEDETLKLSRMLIDHPSGVANLSDFSLQLQSPFKYQGQLNIEKLSLHELLLSLGTGEVPVWLDIFGKAHCQGQIKQFFTECFAQLDAKNLKIKTGMSEKEDLVNVDQFSAQGKLLVDSKAVSYEAALKVGTSQSIDIGKSKGTISYSEGFQISYSTPGLKMANIRNLANLSFAGAMEIEGRTQGDSSTATFEMDIKAKDFIFEKYKLGSPSANLSYKKGILSFEKVLGAYNKTSYVGELQLNLLENHVEGQFSAPTVEVSDVNEILNHLYSLPFPMSGLGQAKMEFEGPLDFWKLNHSLVADFKSVEVSGEKFDSLKIRSKAIDGRITLQGTELEKNKNSISFSGGVLPALRQEAPKLDIEILASNIPIEQSNIISELTSAIFGRLSGSVKVNGNIEAPEVSASARITQTIIDEQEIPDSQLEFFSDRQKIRSTFTLLGRKIRGSVLWPIEKNSTPLKIKLQTDNWNFVSALSLLTGGTHLKDIESLITAELDLESPSGELFKSTGSLYVPNLYLRRGNQFLTHTSPLEVVFDRGLASIKNFNLEGPGNIIRIQGEQFSVDKLNIKLKAEADLRFAHILVPFLEDLGGPIMLNTNIGGSLAQPNIFGSAEVLNGYVKVKGFPHPFERIQSSVSFSQAKIFINSLKAAIASGNLNGNGQITLRGLRDFPTLIQARLENVKFNVPDKVRSSGNADITFSGNWFPFVLSGTYRVDGALVTKEFTEASSVSSIKQSAYLPKILKESNFDPILMDLKVELQKNIVLKNSLADGGAVGTLTVKGPPQNPGLLGKVEFTKNSKLIFKDNIFEIITGSAMFKSANDINPELFISAQSRVGDYDVSLLVQGEAKNPNFVLSSMPPLSDQDLVSLLALGVTSSKLDQSVQSRDQQAQTGYEIGSAIFSNNPLNKMISNNFGWNLRFTTNFDATRNIAVPKFVAEKKLSDRLNATIGRTLDSATHDVKVEYYILNNLSAIGSWEEQRAQEGSDTNAATTNNNTPSIFGLDLEFKKEFK